MGVSKLDLLQGTLDVMVLQTLEVIGPLHGYGIARRIEQDNNRKAKFYSITRAGQKQLAKDAAYWQRLSAVMGRVLSLQGQGGEE
jgi:PadR family transcriptional regulator PadR